MTATEVPIAESTEYRPPTQSQKPNAFVRVDAERGHLVERSGHGNEVLGDCRVGGLVAFLDGSGSPQSIEQPTAGQPRIGQRLQGGKGLGGDDEQRGLRIKIFVFSATSVGSMLEMKRALSPGFTYGCSAS